MNYVPFPSFMDWQRAAIATAQFDSYADVFRKVKEAASDEQVSAALTQAMRYAAVDTNAIEGIYETDRGFTRTVATQTAAWQVTMDARGSHVREAFTDALAGYEYVLSAVTKAAVITEVWIRELHCILCASQETFRVYTQHGSEERPLPKGVYKTMPNSPTLSDGRVHAYAPVVDTPAEMQRLIDEMRTESFAAAHPVVQAAYAHYAYVCVHPFADGNGRVARALASAFLYRSPGVPLVVFSDQRNGYFDALERADAGDPTSFIQFIGARAIDTVGMMRIVLEQTSPPVEQTLARLGDLFNTSANVERLRGAALRLKPLAYGEMKKQFDELVLPGQLTGHVNPHQVRAVESPPGYASIGQQASFWVTASSEWPLKVNVMHWYSVLVRADESAQSDLLVVASTGSQLEVFLSELDPVETEAVRIKVASWIQGALGAFLAEVLAAATRP